MNLKTLSACLLIILLALQLASCATASPVPEIITATSVSTLTPTATPAPSETSTPRPTETNTASPTPELLAPLRSIADFANFDYTEQFWGSRTYTYDEYLKILKEPSSQEIDTNVTPIRFYGAAADKTSAAIHIEGIAGVNMFFQHAVLVKTDLGTYHIAHWKVVYYDEQLQKNVVRDLSFAMEYGQESNKDWVAERNTNIATMNPIQFKILTRNIPWNIPGFEFYDALVTPDPIRENFQNQLITEETGSIFLNMLDIG
jgi:hypothetical protein